MGRLALCLGLGGVMGCTSLLGDFTVSGGPTPDAAPNDAAPTDGAPSSDGDAPSCGSPSTMCGTQCVNTSSDPANCGTCGHDCQGGTCNPGGVCGPVQLRKGEVGLYALAVDDQNVYWTAQDQSGGGSVKDLPLVGAAQPTTLYGTQAPMAPADLVLDGQGRVWFLGNDATNDAWNLFFAKISTPGTGGSVSAAMTGAGKGLACDGTSVYAADDDPNTAAWAVAGWPISGGTAVTVASGSGGRMMGVASGTKDVAWANQVSNAVFSNPKSTPNTPTTIASNMNLAPGMISAGPNAVFWTTFGANNTTGVWSGQFGTQGSGKEIATVSGYQLRLATDNALLFFTDGTGTVGTLTFDGKTETDLFTNRGAPGPIAVNANYIVWYEQGNGSIWRAVR
jgi:hypothetical protein